MRAAVHESTSAGILKSDLTGGKLNHMALCRWTTQQSTQAGEAVDVAWGHQSPARSKGLGRGLHRSYEFEGVIEVRVIRIRSGLRTFPEPPGRRHRNRSII